MFITLDIKRLEKMKQSKRIQFSPEQFPYFPDYLCRLSVRQPQLGISWIKYFRCDFQKKFEELLFFTIDERDVWTDIK